MSQPLTLRHQLTVVIDPDDSAARADADLAAITSGAQVVTHERSNSAYFHQLRRRVAEHPELAPRIGVFFRQDGQLHPIGLLPDDELRWPIGFEQELWEIEVAIDAVRQARRRR